MDNYFTSGRFRQDAAKAGFFSLCATLCLLSFPAIFARYTLALFLVAGFCLWFTGGAFYKEFLYARWYLILPPLMYFTVQLVSLILQTGNIKLLETRLMFLLIPLFGFPVIIDDRTSKGISLLFRSFIAGLTLISVFLIIRIIVVFIGSIPAGQSAFEFLSHHNVDFVSQNFSILEHPSYFSMKIDFALLLLLMLSEYLRISRVFKWTLYLLFSLTLFLLASKSGLIVWSGIIIFAVVRSFRQRNLKSVIYVLLVPVLFGLTLLSVRKIDRLNYFMVYSGRALKQKDFDWKNLDQRTREWYTAISLIKKKPVTGFGIVKIEESMVEEYLSQGFTEEAMQRMNAHNQFLEAQVTFGITGTIVLVWMLLTPILFRRIQRYVGLAVPFVALTAFFLFFESMFNRQWGIMFFLIFYLILVIPPIVSSRAETV